MRIGPTTNSLVVALAIGIMGSALAVSFLYADWPSKARVFDANGNAAGGVAKQKLKRKAGDLLVISVAALYPFASRGAGGPPDPFY